MIIVILLLYYYILPLLLFASFVLFVCVHGNLPRFSFVRVRVCQCPLLLFLLYVRLSKSKPRIFAACWRCGRALCVCPFATFERNTRRENGQIWRVLTCGRFSCGRCRFFRALFKKGRGRCAAAQ